MPKLPSPLFELGKSAGYNPKRRRWCDIGGNIRPKSEIQGQLNRGPQETEAFGFHILSATRTPFSDSMEKVEAIIRGAKRLENVITAKRQDEQPAQPIPSDILAMMRLAEFYTRTEGDVWQHIEAPIDVAVNPLDIQCPDTGAKKELEQLYSPEGVDMYNVLYQSWLSSALYGVALPLEVYEKKQPLAVVMLPPRFVWIGYYISTGRHSMGGSPYVLNPFDDGKAWTDDLVKSTIMPMTYNSFSPQWNEQVEKGWGIPLDPDFLHPVRAKALDFHRYPIPPLARAYRAISTRVVFEEMVRATIEGYRNQLWVFVLGDKDNPPSPQEMSAFKTTLSGMAGERTGYLTWRAPLDVQQHTPKPLDQMLSNETWQAFTLNIFRMLGSNIRVVSGNPTLSSRGDQGIEVDLSLWLKRLEFPREQVMRWERGFRKRWAERSKSAVLIAAMEKTTVRFSRSLIEVGELIKQELQPLYMIGSLSTHTYLERAGYNYEAELELKKQEAPDAVHFATRSTFAQTAVDKGGQSNTVETAPQGRPPDNLNPNEIMAATVDSEKKRRYFAEAYAAFRLLSEGGDPDTFIKDLSALNAEYLPQIASEAYRATGGMGELPNTWASHSANFVNSFAPGFLQALEEANGDYGKFESRAMLYPRTGFAMASAGGQQYAMRERGAKGWRRVLHPERTATGPCEKCVSDSMHVHAIEEPFIALHPNEACDAQEVFIQYYTGGIPSVEIPIPGVTNEQWRDLIKSLGDVGKSVIRRRRA